MAFLAPFVSPKAREFVMGKPSESQQTTTTTTTPTLFGPGQLRTPTRTRALERVTPSLVERGLGGVDPRERRRLRTRAFEDIGLSTKGVLGNLREIFGRTGVRGGVQGSDVSDIIEAMIGARGAASTSIEDILKGDEQQKLQNLLQLLGQTEPFAIGTTGRTVGQGTSRGGQKGFLELLGGGQGISSLATTFA